MKLTFYLLVVLAVPISATATRSDLKPRIIPTQFASDDYVVAQAIVTDSIYGAKADGATDCTAAVQKAADAVADAGGGVVYLPAGCYSFDGNLNLRPNVTLRGDWKQPGATPGSQRVEGTILMPRGGRGAEGAAAFITLQFSACVRNLSIWYPDQSADNVTPYPWTIGTRPQMGGSGIDCFTVKNVTLVNSFQALRFGEYDNELSEVRNVYGTPLKTGFEMFDCSDTPRIAHMRFGPSYWINSGLGATPDKNALQKYLLDHGTGLIFLRTDGHAVADVGVTGYGTGILFNRNPVNKKLPYGHMYDVNTTGCNIGLHAVESGGWQFTRCNLTGSEAGVLAEATHRGFLQFESCRFSAPAAFRSDSSALVQMENCDIAGNVQMTGLGMLSMIDCHLEHPADRVKLAPHVSRALIIGGISRGQVENLSDGDVQIEPAVVKSQPFPQAPPLPPDPRPARPLLFDVADYGAKSDGLEAAPSDNTAAFQKALDAAGKQGGGTVYAAAGLYRFSGRLLVPGGVELRGCCDGAHHAQSAGTVLMPVVGRGQENGQPFIQFSSSSGARGITIYYPDQKIDDVVAYPWTFRSLGPRCYILEIASVNAYQLCDFGSNPSDGHLIRYVMSNSLRKGFWVSKGSGVIDGCTFNPHLWGRQFAGQPPRKSDPSGAKPEYDLVLHQEAITVGSSPAELQINNAVCPGGTGILFTRDGGKAGGGWVINHECDSVTDPLHIRNIGPAGLHLCNTLFAPGWTPSDFAVQIDPECRGNVTMSNMNTWGATRIGALSLMGSGATEIHNGGLGQDRVLVGNGAVTLHAVACGTPPGDNIEIAAPVKKLVLCADTSGGDPFTFPAGKNVFARGNGRDPGGAKLNGRFATYFEAGEPAPLCKRALSNELEESDLRLVPGAGPKGGIGLVLTANPATGAKHPAAIYDLFDFGGGGLAIKPETILRFWLKPGTDTSRNVVIDLNLSDGRNLRDYINDIGNRSMHPMAMRGAVGRWSKYECRVGVLAAGQTIRSIVLIYDTDKPHGNCNLTIGGIEVGEPANASTKGTLH